MPFVLVSRNPTVVVDEEMNDFVAVLREVIAKHLSCEERRLTAKEVSVMVRDTGGFDQNMGNLQIVVLAHNFPSRAKGLDGRTEGILADLRKMPFREEIFGNDSSSIYVSLAQAGFAYL